MAKKKKVTKKRVVQKEKTYFGHSFAFVAIVGGGFVLVSLILLLQGNPSLLFGNIKTDVPAVSEPEQKIASATVVIANNTFDTDPVSVKVGDTVVWENTDTVTHHIVSDDGSFATEDILPGETGSVTFSKEGTFGYHCSLHPVMVGTVNVEGM